MAIYDDKTSGIIKAGDSDNCFIINSVKSSAEAIFKASYIVASNLYISGKITALFNLIVLGDIKAEDIDVKGKLICMGDCTVKNSIIVQDNMFVKQVKAKYIEVHDQITAREIDVDVIKADGNIIVGQTLATEELAFSSQNILCGETAFGAGHISANSIITVEKLDLDDGKDAAVEPSKIVFDINKGENLISSSNKFSFKNDYKSYIAKLRKGNDDFFQKTMVRWGKGLEEIEEVIEKKEIVCFDLGLLLTLTEIAQSNYFCNWERIVKWWKCLLNHFNSIANGEALDMEKKVSISDFTINKKVRHNKYGTGIVTGLKKCGDTKVDILFDSGKQISFNLEIAIKFFTLEKIPENISKELKEKLFLEPLEFSEWIAFLNIVETYGHMFSSNLSKIINDLLYAKIGLKSKFIVERIKENGWDG